MDDHDTEVFARFERRFATIEAELKDAPPFIARTRPMTRLQRASRSLATVGVVAVLVVGVLTIGPMLTGDRAAGPTASSRASDKASGSASPASPGPSPSAAAPARLTLSTDTIEWCGSIGGCATYAILIRDDDTGAREVPVPLLPDEGEVEHEGVLPSVIGPGSYVARFRLAAVSDAQAVGSPRDETTLWTCESSFEVTNESAVHIAASFLRDWCDVTTTYEPAAPGGSAPRVVCAYPKRPTTLTCDSAIEAAMTALPGDADVVSIEFRHSDGTCPPGTRCARVPPNTGYVRFDLAGGSDDLGISVAADDAGHVSVGHIEQVEPPGPSATAGPEPSATLPADAGPALSVRDLASRATDLDGRRVLVQGFMMVMDDWQALCSGVGESYPPHCGGPRVDLVGTISGTVRGELDVPTLCGDLAASPRPTCGPSDIWWGDVEVVGVVRADERLAPSLEIEAIRVIGR